ncbi:MAG: DNA polymerase III subunit alpha [Bacteroidetes bacterium]|nr:DNA polymerase III subunit alpha [Bacteroidota bacterium]
MVDFVHLHIHTQFSILDGACRIPDLIAKAVKDGMKGIAITDHGNMFGVKIFHEEACKTEGFKPIIGCETYVARRHLKDKSELADRKGDHLILLAKNALGYSNLVKLISWSWIDGHYYKPRIDKDLLRQYHEGLIGSSACLAGEIPRAILAGNLDKAEKAINEYQEIFGDDFYLELMRHKTDDPTRDTTVYHRQAIVNEALIKLSAKSGVKLIATNDAHFLDEMDANAHDRLLCLHTGKDIDDPTRLRYTGQEWVKTRAEMQELFRDIPETLKNTMELFDKIEFYPLNKDPIMPDFPLPEGFSEPMDYLQFLTYEGAKTRYPEITFEIRERIDFELETIKTMGYPGYFLIVHDFLNVARGMGVSVGPGRGSAAGSVVAYCIRITDVEPLRYGLLFERFLNVDRVSMPDIDIDFDEDGRDKVLAWVVNKYGKDKVAQVITFGTMAAKMAIRDLARVQKLPLQEADRLAKLVPDRPGITLKEAYKEVPELEEARHSGNPLISETLKYAETLEGSVRHTGIHACGIIICRDNLIEHVPVTTYKDSDLLVSQYDGKHIESVGMLKMDFLGLKTLAIIKDTLRNIRISRGEELNENSFPFDDELTWKLFSQGKTTGIFQFESDGMKKYLKELMPTRIEDLIAMNALYRPGPMEYIPQYINRKYGRDEIKYDIPIMDKYLHETYGITVYQEQVMQLSQLLGDFTKGEADTLRKAMGKKDYELMNKLQPTFIENGKKNGHNETIIRKIWKDWEAFSNYAFNKSHSTCYAYVAYRMAYLKAHYPAEFMAAVLSRNMNDIKEITNFSEESRRMGIPVLGPSVNESDLQFMVNKKGEIRFGMKGIKNVGENAAQNIVDERNKNGSFIDIFDFTRRVDSRSVNKRCFESLAKAGAFDTFEGSHRAQYFFKSNGDDTVFLEKIVKYGSDFQARATSIQHSLFESGEKVMLPDLLLPKCEAWSKLEQLRQEKEVTGFYMTGHPLDTYKHEIENFCSVSVVGLRADLKVFKGREITFGGMVTIANRKTGKNGKPFGIFTIEDYFDSIQLTLFSEDLSKWSDYFQEGKYLFIKARVEPRFDSQDQLTIKVVSVSYLADLFAKLARTITVILNLEELSGVIIDIIQSVASENKGKCSLHFQVFDENDKIYLDLVSGKYKVDAKNFATAMTEYPGIKYKVG